MGTKQIYLLLTVVVIALSVVLGAQNRRSSRSVNTGTSSDRAVTDCTDIRITFDRRPALVQESQMTVPAAQISGLRTQMDNVGIYVTGWDRSEYSVKTCKAIPDNDPNPNTTFREIDTTFSNGHLSVSGPAGREWQASLIVMVPRLVTVDMQTGSGPLQLRDLAGHAECVVMQSLCVPKSQ